MAAVVRFASFVHEPENCWPVVSVLCTWSAVHVTGALTLSDPVVRTVTGLTYQTLEPRVPSTTESVAAVPGECVAHSPLRRRLRGYLFDLFPG